jgi:4-amino-4-deoxy-L-arabinose transferase-like glycosyltransferase
MLFESRRANIFALFCCILFILAGAFQIWRPGIQTDEALFTAGIYAPALEPENKLRVFGHDYLLMVMTYVGTLKARVWSPIFRVFGVTAASIRMPAVLIGAATVWLFYRLLVRTLGVRAAIVGCGLLATDSLYLLTIRWDWGPVAFQHLLLIGGMLAIVRWRQEDRLRFLAIGFFLFGLAVWDKALFVWSLAGLGAATIAIFPREFHRSLSLRTLGVATVAFVIGAFPLILYNLSNGFVTFQSNTVRSTEDLRYKASLLRDTVDSSAMFGFITRVDREPPPRAPVGWLERLITAVSDRTGQPRQNAQLFLLAVSLLALPLYWKTGARRAVLFALVFSGVTWAQMASVQHGGTGVHHTILLWPMPALVIAAGFGALSERVNRGAWLIGLVTAVSMAAGLLVTSTYYRDLLRNGGTSTWSDAIYPAAAALNAMKPEDVYIVEWGFFDNLRAFSKGRLPLGIPGDPGDGETARREARAQMSNPHAVFVAHAAGSYSEPERTGRILQFAEAEGFRRTNVKTFYDTNGRPIIEVFSFTASLHSRKPTVTQFR